MCKIKGLGIALTVFFLVLSSPFTVNSPGSYFDPCALPPVVTQAVVPNVILCMDYSQSMQLPAYYFNDQGNKNDEKWLTFFPDTTKDQILKYYYDENDATPTIGEYNPLSTYIGSFQPDTYYVYKSGMTEHYWEAAATQPTETATKDISATSDGGQTVTLAGNPEITEYYMIVTAPAHGFEVGDVVVFSNMSSHTGLNGNAYEIKAKTSDTFKIIIRELKKTTSSNKTSFEFLRPNSVIWNGSPDEAGGKVRKRITGHVETGINGTVLNFVAMSRMDVMLAAMIGGRQDPVKGCSEAECYVKGISAWTWVREQSNIKADFYVRPATLPANATWVDFPNNYDTGTYLEKTTFVTITGKYAGELDADDPYMHGEVAECWKFSIPTATEVKIKLSGDWNKSKGYRLVLYPNSDFPTIHTPVPGGEASTTSATTVTLTVTLNNPGTYYLRVAPSDGETSVPSPGTYHLSSNVSLHPYTEAHTDPTSHDGVDNPANSKIGALPWGRILVKTPYEKRKGLVQDVFPFVRLGFVFFNGNSKDETEGKILVGLHNSTLDGILNAFQGQGSAENAWAYPMGLTPTAETFREVYDYLKQFLNSDNADNSAFIAKGTAIDPFFENGGYVPCRKNYLILVSDGEATGSDPAMEAKKLHDDDIRGELPGKQILDIYSVYAFSATAETLPVDEQRKGASQMMTISQYGSYTEIEGCNKDWPYPDIGSVDSADPSRWPLHNTSGTQGCDPDAPNGLYPYDSCCAEWDKVWDRNNDGILEQKGIPDTYFEAKDGTEFLKVMKAVFDEILVRTAAASAVATISQEIQGGDVIMRGAFEAANPSGDDAYFWFGHIESYWPFLHDGEYKYAFELPCNADLLCHEMPGSGAGDCTAQSECLDLATVLLNQCSSYNASNPPRKIFSWLDNDYDTTDSDDSNSDGIADLGDGKVQPDEIWYLTEGNYDKFATRLGMTQDCDGDGIVGGADSDDVKELIKWAHGTEVVRQNASGEDYTCFRSVKDEKNVRWIMGDIVYSTPVIVGTPSLGGVSQMDFPDTAAGEDPNSGWTGYQAYRNDALARLQTTGAKTSRKDVISGINEVEKKMVYVGANDGMLHAFVVAVWDWDSQRWIYNPNDTSVSTHFSNNSMEQYIGQELWAYIPSNLLSDIGKMAEKTYGTKSGCKHITTVDLAPRASYVFIDHDRDPSTARQWRTVLIGGERGGGDVVFAMDVTNPDAPNLLWEFSVLKNLVVHDSGTDFVIPSDMQQPANYAALKKLPLAWSRPVVGRMYMPDTTELKLYTKLTSEVFVDRTKIIHLTDNEAFDPAGQNKRHIVFFGGGFHIYDTALTFESPYPSITASADLLNILRRPNLMAIDIETGENLFRYTWPWVYSNYGSTLFPDMSRGPSTNPTLYKVPYAMGDISIADLIRGRGGNYYPGTDGLIDHIYVGDMTGYLWGFTFIGFERYFPAGDPRGIRVDLWTTKAIDESETSYYWSHFRSLGQPITVQPALSIDKYNERYLRIIFGAGKFDDVMGNYDDKSDPAKTSIYNLRTSIFPSSEAPDYTVSPLLSSALNFWFRIKCRNQATGSPLVPDMTKRRTNFGTGCKWMSSEGTGDCCEAQSGTSVACNDPGLANPPCWQCVYDLLLPSTAGAAGERVTNKALIAGGLVFVTSFLPPADRCTAQGEGYLYIFDYMCRRLPDGFKPVQGIPGVTAITQTVGGVDHNIGFQVGLGSGLPSAPVLDSAGENVIVQMSNADLIKIPVELLGKPFQLKGWREKH